MSKKFKIDWTGAEISMNKGGGVLMLFGFPFFLAGTLVMMTAVFPNFVKVEGDMSPFGQFIFGSVFALVGGILMFGRMGIKINKSSQLITTWWGILFPFKSTHYQLSKISYLSQSKVVRKSNNSNITVYPLSLKGEGLKIDVVELGTPEESRKLGEQLSNFLELDLEDSIAGTPILRKAGTLDHSIRDRVLESGEDIKIPSQPVYMKSKIRESGDGLEIDIPSFGFDPKVLAVSLPGLIFSIYVYFNFLGPLLNGPNPSSMKWVMVGFIGFFFVCLPIFTPLIFIARKVLSSTSLKITRDKVVCKNGWPIKRTISLSSEEIEEMVFPSSSEEEDFRDLPQALKFARKYFSASSSISLKADKATLTFGYSLDKDELFYIGARIKRIIAS